MLSALLEVKGVGLLFHFGVSCIWSAYCHLFSMVFFFGNYIYWILVVQLSCYRQYSHFCHMLVKVMVGLMFLVDTLFGSISVRCLFFVVLFVWISSSFNWLD